MPGSENSKLKIFALPDIVIIGINVKLNNSSEISFLGKARSNFYYRV